MRKTSTTHYPLILFVASVMAVTIAAPTTLALSQATSSETIDLAVASRAAVKHPKGFKKQWVITGNPGTTPGINFIGTTDNEPLEIHVNGARVMRYEPAITNASSNTSPNVIGGDASNSVTTGVQGATIAGGGGVINNGLGGTVSSPNAVQADRATISGGNGNIASGVAATIAGGGPNTASGNLSTVGGGESNTASGFDTTVAGGTGNSALADADVVGGGSGNTANSFTGVIGSLGATVAGGISNTAAGEGATVGGGFGNTAGSGTGASFDDTVAGGSSNLAAGGNATVAGGGNNSATFAGATIGGGVANTATGDDAVVGGGSSNTASGAAAAVPGGVANVASGNNSFAAGSLANASHVGAFIWADNIASLGFNSIAVNEFAARATGGVRFVTAVDGTGNPTAGVSLAAGGSAWSSLSDRNAKANFALVNGEQVVEQLAAIPVESWNYKTQNPSIRHIGPMAQDFHAAFGVGEDNTHITTIDSEGVALAAIQGLYKMIREKDEQLSAQQDQITALRARLDRVEQAGRRATHDTQTALINQP